MWFGCGLDAVRTRFGRGSEVARACFGSGADSMQKLREGGFQYPEASLKFSHFLCPCPSCRASVRVPNRKADLSGSMVCKWLLSARPEFQQCSSTFCSGLIYPCLWQKRNNTPPCSSEELLFARRHGGHRAKISVVDMVPFFYRALYLPAGLESFS